MAIKSPTLSLKDRISSPLASPLWGNTTPTRHSFASSAFTTLKQLIRSSVTTAEPPIRERIVHIGDGHNDYDGPSPALSDVSGSTVSTALTSDSVFSHRLHWPASPAYGSEPATPFTPFTVASPTSTTKTGSALSKLGLHAGALSPHVSDTDGVKSEVGSGEDSPRMVMESSGREVDEWLRGDEGEEKGEMDAIEEWYRQVQLQPASVIEDEPVSPLADTAITPRATPVSTPTMTRFPEKAAGVPAGEPVSPLAESALTPRATPVSTPTLARFPARGEEGEVVEARELSTTPKATPKPADRVASWFMRTSPKPTPSPPQGVKTADRIVEETAEARRLSTTPKPTVTPVQAEQPRRLNITPKPPLLIIPKPIRATIQHTRTITNPYAPKPKEHQTSITPSTPLPSTQPPKQHQPLSITTTTTPALPTHQPPTSPQPTTTPLSFISHQTTTPLSTITPKLSPVPHPHTRSPLASGGRERSPILRVQTNFSVPSPHNNNNSPQPVSALSLASTSTNSSSSRGTSSIDTPILFLPGTPDTEPGSDDEEGLTARPQPTTWGWDGMGMGLSIDEVVRSPVTAVEMMGGMGGLLFPSKGGGGGLPLTPLPFSSPITPISAIPLARKQQPFGPLTPGAGVSMARFEVNTPRHQMPLTPRYHGGVGMWQGGGGGMLSPQQPTSALWRGPMTPNGYDDISPITRGEWGFLMGGGAGGVGRLAGVGRVDVEGGGMG